MALTYALIGTRPDVGIDLARIQLTALLRESPPSTAWGLGFFDKDEVLLRKGPGSPDDSGLLTQLLNLRSHSLLLHQCHLKERAQSSDAAPPLRYGHTLFTCQGVEAAETSSMSEFVRAARESLPEFLRRSLKGETFSEVAFALFLAQLPSGSLERTKRTEGRHSADLVANKQIEDALRAALLDLDRLGASTNCPVFSGSLWAHTGETLHVAHREGSLGLKVLRGRSDLVRLGIPEASSRQGLDQSLFAALVAGDLDLDPSWERLPSNLVITVNRGGEPTVERL